MERYRYIIFPTCESPREIILSCSIRPGALEESYSFEWVSHDPEAPGFSVINSKNYDIPVVTDASSSLQLYQCRVTIQHRSDQDYPIIIYNGPMIVLEKKGEIVCESNIS